MASALKHLAEGLLRGKSPGGEESALTASKETVLGRNDICSRMGAFCFKNLHPFGYKFSLPSERGDRREFAVPRPVLQLAAVERVARELRDFAVHP